MAVCFVFLYLDMFGHQTPAIEVQSHTEYRCPPCGCNQDELLFLNPGVCPACKMELVQVPKGFAKTVDHQVAPFLVSGMLGQFYTKLIYPVFAIAILFSLFVFFKNIRGKSLNVFLSGIILVLSLYGFKNQLYGVDYGLTNTFKSLFAPISFILCLGPLVFFYVQSLTKNTFKWKRIYWLHFIPTTLTFAYYSILSIVPEDIKLQFLHSPFEASLSHLEQVLSVFIGLLYTCLAYRFFMKWKNTTPIKNKKMSAWLLRFLIGTTLLFLFWGFMILLNSWIYSFGVATVSYNPLWLVFGITLLWLGIEIVYNSKFFLLNRYMNSASLNISYSAKELSTLKVNLEQLMEQQKMYLDPNLSLGVLANAVILRPKQLSGLLNNMLGKSFYDFVNEYRIKDAKERLVDLQNKNLTIEAIANQSGFKSKSSFNNAFRKQTGITPREYIKQHG